jgi:hypothetical protein
MTIPRKLGILIFFGVPIIIGGGIVYHLSGGSYTAVGIFEAVLLAAAGGLVSK